MATIIAAINLGLWIYAGMTLLSASTEDGATATAAVYQQTLAAIVSGVSLAGCAIKVLFF